MKTIVFDNLIDAKTGKVLSVQVPDNYEIPLWIGKRAAAFGKKWAEAAKIKPLKPLSG